MYIYTCEMHIRRYAEFLEMTQSDAEGAGEMFRRCHEADALNLLGLLGLAGRVYVCRCK